MPQQRPTMTAVVASAVIIVGAALAPPACADPAVPNPNPDAAAAAPPPPSVLQPQVPEIPNPVYGSGNGPIGTIRDIWHQARGGGIEDLSGAPDDAPRPPPGAGPAPALPPGYSSINAPESSTPARVKEAPAGVPDLPPGYYPLNGPPPPGYEFKGQEGNAPAPQAPATP